MTPSESSRITLLCGAVSAGVWAVLINLFYLTFFVMRSSGSGARLNAAAWALCSAGLYLVSALLLRRGVNLSALALADTALAAASLYLVLRLSPGIAGIPMFFGAAFLLTGDAIVCFSSWHPPTLPQLLTQLDALLLGTVWSCLICISAYGRPGDLMICLAALVAEVAAVLLLRTFGHSRNVLYGSRVRGALLCGGLLAGVCALMALLLRFLSGSVRTLTGDAARGVGRALAFLWEKVDLFFHWFFSLFPVPDDAEDAAAASQAGGSSSSVSALGLDWSGVLQIAFLALLGAAAAVLIFFLIRNRKKRVRAKRAPLRAVRGDQTRVRSGGAGRAFRALLFELRFRLVFFLRRKTPEGLLVFLQAWGKLHRVPRGRGETYRAYFRRLAAYPGLNGDREALLRDLEALGDHLDNLYFGAGRAPFPRAILRRIHHTFAGIRPPEEPAPGKNDPAA